MANTKSITKIFNYLEEKGEAVTPSEICQDVSLRWKTVQEVLEFLEQSKQVIILENGKTTLVKIGDNYAVKNT